MNLCQRQIYYSYLIKKILDLNKFNCAFHHFSYEVLKDSESREEYNYMLDHPEEMWQNYYRYYRRRLAPKVDVRLVLIITITIISAIQVGFCKKN